MVQNKYTKIAIYALIISSILGSLLIGSVYEFFSNSEGIEFFSWFLVLLVPLGIVINLYVAYKIHRGSLGFIKFAFWMYLLQILGLDSPNFEFSITLGFSFNITLSVYDVSIVFNLFAILMSVILYKAMRHANET